MTKPTLKIKLVNFWDTAANMLQVAPFSLLATRYQIEISNTPDLLFYSIFGSEHIQYDCLKIFITGENIQPDFRNCDYSFSFEPTDERNFQLPIFAYDRYFQAFLQKKPIARLDSWKQAPKSRFCNFVYHNQTAKLRNDFCRQLAQYKHIDCPSTALNNMPPIENSFDGGVEDKLNFIRQYKFTLAFENTSQTHYTTEKLLHPLFVGSIPIYWGDPRATEYFNREAFINCHDFDSLDAVIEHVKTVDNDDTLYAQYLDAPHF